MPCDFRLQDQSWPHHGRRDGAQFDFIMFQDLQYGFLKPEVNGMIIRLKDEDVIKVSKQGILF